MIVIETFAGDSAPSITMNITREDGTIVSLVGATVWLIIQNPDTKAITNNPSGNINNLCSITNGAAGQCVYTWNSGGTDCPVPGIYFANLKIRYSNGQKETYAVRIAAANPIAFVS
jgi:hypothetical protein